MNDDLLGALGKLALLLVGGGLTILGGYLADKRAEGRDTRRAATEASTRLLDRQLEAAADVIAASVLFTNSAGAVGLAITANARSPLEFANTDTVSEHGPVSKEMRRAVALAQLVLRDETQTAQALDEVSAALLALPTAWGKAMSANSTRQPLEAALAGPIVTAEGALQTALDRFVAAAKVELLPKD